MTELEWLELKEGDKVKAKDTVYDLPPDKSLVHADPGDLGEVIHVEPGHRTVRFFPRKTCTDVHWTEIDLVESLPLDDEYFYNDLQRRAMLEGPMSPEHTEWMYSLLLRLYKYWQEPDTPLPAIDMFDEVARAVELGEKGGGRNV